MNRIHHTLVATFAEQLTQAENYERAFFALENFVRGLGFEGVLYTYIPRLILSQSHVRQPIYTVSEAYSPDYIAHYMEARFDLHDPIVKAIDQGALHELDWWQEIEKKRMSASERAVIETARADYGLQNGFTVPFLSGPEGIAGASIISGDGARHYHILKIENVSALNIGLRLFHGAVMSSKWRKSNFLTPIIGELTKSERIVLQGLSQGLSVKQVSAQSGIGIRYVEKLVRSLRVKFGGETREGQPAMVTAELMYHAGLLSYFS